MFARSPVCIERLVPVVRGKTKISNFHDRITRRATAKNYKGNGKCAPSERGTSFSGDQSLPSPSPRICPMLFWKSHPWKIAHAFPTKRRFIRDVRKERKGGGWGVGTNDDVGENPSI